MYPELFLAWVAMLPYGLNSNVTKLLANLLTKPSVFYYFIIFCSVVLNKKYYYYISIYYLFGGRRAYPTHVHY